MFSCSKSGTVSSSDGSCLVTLGATSVVCGIKLVRCLDAPFACVLLVCFCHGSSLFDHTQQRERERRRETGRQITQRTTQTHWLETAFFGNLRRLAAGFNRSLQIHLLTMKTLAGLVRQCCEEVIPAFVCCVRVFVCVCEGRQKRTRTHTYTHTHIHTYTHTQTHTHTHTHRHMCNG